MDDIADSGFWITTRPHEDDCPAKSTDKNPKPRAPCKPGCRVGAPWPTLLLLPHERKYMRLPDRPVVGPVSGPVTEPNGAVE